MDINITELEKLVIENIALNDYTAINAARPETVEDVGGVWSDCLDCGPNEINRVSIPGVVSSLVKKGLVETNGETGRDACVYLTDRGLEAFKKLFPKKNGE